MTLENPASIMVPMLQFNTNMMAAAKECCVDWYLYTSSVGVYQPAELLREEDVWATQPSNNDFHGGWAKRIGELQAEAYSCLLYTSPSPRDQRGSRMPSSA